MERADTASPRTQITPFSPAGSLPPSVLLSRTSTPSRILPTESGDLLVRSMATAPVSVVWYPLMMQVARLGGQDPRRRGGAAQQHRRRQAARGGEGRDLGPRRRGVGALHRALPDPG